MEVNAAEVFLSVKLAEFVLSGWKRLKDAFIEFFSMKEQVQDVQHISWEMNTDKHVLHTQIIHIYNLYQLDCNSG